MKNVQDNLQAKTNEATNYVHITEKRQIPTYELHRRPKITKLKNYTNL